MRPEYDIKFDSAMATIPILPCTKILEPLSRFYVPKLSFEFLL